MTPQELVKEIKASHEFFNRSSRELTEADSKFCPKPGTLTVAQQVAHTAGTIEWFVDGAFNPKGFDADFETQAKKYMTFTSLTKAREWLEKAYANATETVGSKSQADLNALTASGPIMGGQPRWAAILGLVEHTAHHRGALSVYTRLVGKVPPMPYMDM
jgi:uncharacterized damage-inducible protein DinB